RQRHEGHGREDHPAWSVAVDQSPENGLTGPIDQEARGNGERERRAVAAELAQDGLEEDPECEVDPRGDEQDGEAGRQRPRAPRAGCAHRAVRTMQVPTAWA